MKCLQDPGRGFTRPTAGCAIGPSRSRRSRPHALRWTILGDAGDVGRTRGDDARTSRRQQFRLVHGNTSFGVYEQSFPRPRFCRHRLVPELHVAAVLDEWPTSVPRPPTRADRPARHDLRPAPSIENTTAGAAWLMARRTAGASCATPRRSRATPCWCWSTSKGRRAVSVRPADHAGCGRSRLTVWWRWSGGESRALPLAELIAEVRGDRTGLALWSSSCYVTLPLPPDSK